MEFLIPIGIIVMLVLIGRGSLGAKLTGGTSNIETWAQQSWFRVIGLPAAFVAFIYFFGFLTGTVASVVQVFPMAFLLFILYAFSTAFTGRSGVRIGVSMAFFGVIIGSIVAIYLRLNGIA
jgi:hypothetical protein